MIFSRPFGTNAIQIRFPGVETPGYCQNVPPGQPPEPPEAIISAAQAIRIWVVLHNREVAKIGRMEDGKIVL